MTDASLNNRSDWAVVWQGRVIKRSRSRWWMWCCARLYGRLMPGQRYAVQKVTHD